MLSEPIISLLIFCLVVFLYIHMSAEWKKSEDLEVYESPFTTPSHLAEICDVKQPVIFQVPIDRLSPFFAKMARMDKHEAADVLVKDVREYFVEGAPSPEPVVLPLHSAKRLVASDSGKKYLAEQNDAFLEETGLSAAYAGLDWALRPHACVAAKYDYVFGSAGVYTPYRYHTHSRMFIVPIAGRVRVKLAPWKMSKYLWPIKDYETYEFRSALNPYEGKDIDKTKIKGIDVDVLPGQMLFVPPHWWYSVKLTKDTTAATFVYNTAINALANGWDWAKYLLQQNNITQRIMAPVREPAPNEIPALDSALPNEEIKEHQTVIHVKEKDEVKEIITNAGTYTV
jgi:hypothetical protein